MPIAGLRILATWAALVLVILWPAHAMAQGYNSLKGTFQVDEIKGCVNFTTTITIQPTVTNGNCTVFNIIPGDGALERQNAVPCTYSYTYTKTGQYWLKVRTQGGANNTDSIRITVEPDVQPEFLINTCSQSGVQVRITDRNYDQYFIDYDYQAPTFTTDTAMATSLDPRGTFRYPSTGTFSIAVQGKDINSARNCSPRVKSFDAVNALSTVTPTSIRVSGETAVELDYPAAANMPYRLDIAVNSDQAFQQLKTINPGEGGTRTETLPDLNTGSNFYCIRLRTVDACASTTQAGGFLCSIRFNLSIENDINRLTWNTSTTGLSGFSILRNTEELTTTTALTYNDAELTCATDYCYKIVAQLQNGATSHSLERCGKSRTARIPPAVRNISSIRSPMGDEIQLQWTAPQGPAAKAWTLYRSDNGTTFTPAQVSENPGYEGATPDVETPPLFRLNYTDVCEMTSPFSQTFQPLSLSGTVEKDNSIQLIWNKYRGYENGIRPDSIMKYDQNGTLLRSYVTGDTTFLDTASDTLNQVVAYRIRSTSRDAGTASSWSNTITLTREARLFFPTAFTPDGNRLNEGFRVYGQFLRRIRLQIFDRWGTLLFSSDSDEAGGIRTWNGNGPDDKAVPQSVYVWKAIVTDFTGKDFLRTGSLALIRK